MRIYNQGVYTNSYRKNNNNLGGFNNNSVSSSSSSSSSLSNIMSNIRQRQQHPSKQQNGNNTITVVANFEEDSENTNPMDGGIVASSSSSGLGLGGGGRGALLQKGLSYRGDATTVPTAVETAPIAAASSSSTFGGGEQGEPIPEGGACNLCYEPDSSGRLVEHYLKPNADQNNNNMAIIGRWIPGDGKNISGFKFKRNCGRSVLIGNCSAGVLGRRNYCNGFCQFVKSAKLMKGRVTLYDVSNESCKSMPVDVYLYYNDPRPGYQTLKLIPGQDYTTDNVLAVGVLPRGGTFYERETVDLLKWLFDAESRGYSSKI